jgi:glycosyltransferase involved in cell wall biosynthesis
MGTARAVVHAADYGGSYPGNFVASLRSLAGPCRELGLRLVLAFSARADGARPPWMDALRDDGIPVHVIDRRGSLRERARAIGEVVRAEDAAILHTHFTRWDVPGLLAGVRTDAAVLWHLHSPFPERGSLGYVARTAVKLRLLGRRARIAAVSQRILADALRLGFPAGRAVFVPNAIDLDHATRGREDGAGLRRRLGLPPSATVGLAFGWEPPRKGIDLALEAFGVLAAEGREVGLVVVGTEALAAFVRDRYGAAPPAWLRVLPPRERVGELYGAADVFLSASRAEGFPYALGEALANGLPAAVSDIPGVEWARELPSTASFPSGDARALAGAMAEVASWDAARRTAAGEAARSYARRHLSLDGWAARVAGIYRASLRGDRE